MRMVSVILMLLMLGCGAQPAPHMFGAQRHEIWRGGFHFVIFQKGERVEIIRLGWAKAGQHQTIRALMIDLIPEVTGCKILPASLQGDSGEMRGRLSC